MSAEEGGEMDFSMAMYPGFPERGVLPRITDSYSYCFIIKTINSCCFSVSTIRRMIATGCNLAEISWTEQPKHIQGVHE